MGGRAFADARGQASLYPGYAGDVAMGQAIIGGGVYGPLDGAIAGVVFAGLYNCCPGGSN